MFFPNVVKFMMKIKEVVAKKLKTSKVKRKLQTANCRGKSNGDRA